MSKKFGCLPPKRLYNQPAFTSRNILSADPATRLDRSHINPAPRMLGNDTLSNCTSAGIGNYLRAVSSLAAFQTNVTEENAVMFYEESAGYRGTPETDMGAAETEVLSYAMRNGYPTDGGVFYPLWGSCQPTVQNIARVTQTLGAAYLGIKLTHQDMEQISQPGAILRGGLDNSGIAGLHCLLSWDYTGLTAGDTVSLITWGEVIRVSWEWLMARVLEAHGMIWPQLKMPHGLYPTGGTLEDIRRQNVRFLRG